MADDFKAQVTDEIQRLRGLVQQDGGDIELVSIDEDTKVVSIRFQGACVGCPGAAMTLKMGIERNLKMAIPEVAEVVAVN